MRIGFNALLLAESANYRQTGISRYLSSLLKALSILLDEDELIVYAGSGAAPLNTKLAIHWHYVRWFAERPETRLLWEHVIAPIASKRAGVDVFHGPVNVVPRGLSAPSVVTVHDLAFFRWPEQVPARRYRYLSRELTASVHRADRILAISEATKRDLVEQLNADPGKIVCTPLGVDEHFRKVDELTREQFRTEHKIERPYILSVSTLEPRKNLARLLDAFAMISDRIPHDLVLVGPKGWLTDALFEDPHREKLRDRIRLTGFVPENDLPKWYSCADLFALPSLYEGFGLPVLEAMACGVPVLTSNCSSLPEVVGDAAIMVTPINTDEIAHGMFRLIDDRELANDLRRNGPKRAELFTWQRTAELTLATYREMGS